MCSTPGSVEKADEVVKQETPQWKSSGAAVYLTEEINGVLHNEFYFLVQCQSRAEMPGNVRAMKEAIMAYRIVKRLNGETF